MAENSIFWTTDGTGDGGSGGYTQAEAVNFWLMKTFCGSMTNKGGVLLDVDNELAVSGTSSPIDIDSGAAYVYGFPYENTAATTEAITTPVVGTTGFRIVLRASWAAQTVRITEISSADGVAAIPAAVQTANTTWDITLATGTITTGGTIALTDAREFINFSTEVDADMLDVAIAGDGLTGGGGTALSVVVDDQTIEINADTLRVQGGGISLNEMAANSVDSDQYVDGSIDLVHMSANSVDSPQYVDGSIDLVHMSANSVDSDQYVDGSIDTVHLSNDSVDDTKVGNRVPQFYRRQGGSSTNWATAGTGSRTPTTVRMQSGALNLAGPAFQETVTFPEAFSNVPLVQLTVDTVDMVSYAHTISSTQLIIQGTYIGASTPPANVDAYWLAIGPE